MVDCKNVTHPACYEWGYTNEINSWHAPYYKLPTVAEDAFSFIECPIDWIGPYGETFSITLS